MLPHPAQAFVSTVPWLLAFLGGAHYSKGLRDGCFNSLNVALAARPAPVPAGGAGMPAFQLLSKSQWSVLGADCCLQWVLRGGEGAASPQKSHVAFWVLSWTGRTHHSQACEELENKPEPKQSLFVFGFVGTFKEKCIPFRSQ